MYEYAIIWDWAGFAVRWLHVVAAIAWIGSSFFYIAVDLGLVKRPGLPEGVSGEEWQVHGGGFYQMQKYLVAPKEMPDHLTWHKWESYTTWMSGFALLAVVYYGGADFYLIDRHLLDVSTPVAILISMGSLTIGWVVYNALCKSPIGKSTWGLMGLLFVLLVIMAWGYTQIFTGRAAFLHLGAYTATIMSANVFFVIIPNQKIAVADLKEGRLADPKYGVIAKQRSLHNNYLTLPVIFFMLSNHYPLAFATEYNWIIAGLVFLMGVTIRHWFNTVHARKGHPHWTWAITAILFVLIMWLSTVPKVLTGEAENVKLSAIAESFKANPHFGDVVETVSSRCSMCHASEPVVEGLMLPPKGVLLDTEEAMATHARDIYLQAGRSHAMPPGNQTDVTQEERALIVAWYESTIAK